MQRTITITVPEEFATDLEEAAIEDGCTEEEVILDGLRKRIEGSRIRSLADLKAAAKSKERAARE